VLDKQGNRRKWSALNEYFLKDGNLFKKPTVAQKEAGMGNRQVVLDHKVYDISIVLFVFLADLFFLNLF